MSRRLPPAARTRGPLRIYRDGQIVQTVANTAATKAARLAVRDAARQNGAHPDDH